MAFVPVANTVMVELRYTYFGQQCENTLYFQRSPDAADSSLLGLGNEVLLWWNASIRPYLSNSLTLREIYLTDLSSETAESYTLTPPTPLPTGGDTQPGLPGNVSLAVSFRTARRGRSYRGRNYVVGIVEPAVTGNTASNDFVAGMQDGYNDIPTSGIADNWVWVVVSRFSGNVPRVAGVATPVTAAVVVDPVVDSQRRRLPGRGN